MYWAPRWRRGPYNVLTAYLSGDYPPPPTLRVSGSQMSVAGPALAPENALHKTPSLPPMQSSGPVLMQVT